MSNRKSKAVIRDFKLLQRCTTGAVKTFIGLFISGFLAGIAYEEIIGIGTWHGFHVETKELNICFTPPSGCSALIAQQISKAQ